MGDLCLRTREVVARHTLMATADDMIEVQDAIEVVIIPQPTTDTALEILVITQGIETTSVIQALHQIHTLGDLRLQLKAFPHDHLHLVMILIEISTTKPLHLSGTTIVGHRLVSLPSTLTAAFHPAEVARVTLSHPTTLAPTPIADPEMTPIILVTLPPVGTLASM